MMVKPGSDFPHQSVSNRQHAAKRSDDPDSNGYGARPMHDMRRFDQLHGLALILRLGLAGVA
jgi:hypothetical protein